MRHLLNAQSQERQASFQEGFSLLELVAVVSVLSILAGISIPAFLGFIKSARIDQAKATLNSAIAECLQISRTDPDNANSAEVPKEKLTGLDSAGYVVSEGKDKCFDFMIKPKDEGESYLYSIGFMVRDGKVSKIAIPAKDQASRKSCESWGTCGIPPELQAEWDRLAELAEAKKECNEDFYTWLRKPSSGVNNRWDEASDSCTVVTWAFEGSIQINEEAYKAAEQRKYGEICAQKTKDIKDAGEETGGPYTITECGLREFYFCKGEDKGTYEAMEACIADHKEQQCIADRENARTSGHEGQYGPIEGPGQCGDTKWMCQKVMVDSEEEFKSLQEEKKACGYVPPESTPPAETPPSEPAPDPAEVCGEPQFSICKSKSFYKHSLCKTWSSCMGYI